MPDRKEQMGNEQNLPLYTVTSASPDGLFYRISPDIKNKNDLKNAYNTDMARERGLVPETEEDEGLK